MFEENLDIAAEEPAVEDTQITETEQQENTQEAETTAAQEEAAAPQQETAAQNSGKEYSKNVAKRISETYKKAAEETANRYEESLKPVYELLKTQGYDVNSIEELKAIQQAEELNIDPSAYAKLVNSIREDIEKNSPTIQQSREFVAESKRRSDLEAIKAVYPDVKAESVFDLGDVFVKLMRTGEVDALTAYEAQLAAGKRNAKEAPKSPGQIASPSGSKTKEYYTPEDVDKLTDEDYDKDPNLLERVRNSMLKWK